MKLLIAVLLLGSIAPTGSLLAAPTTIIDATNSGLNGDDVMTDPISIGFSFEFFGNTYTNLRIDTNGILTFGDPYPSAGNMRIPTPSTPPSANLDNFIAPFWDDLRTTGNPSKSGYLKSIYYATTGVAPNRQFIVQWTDMHLFATNIPFGTFQVILFEETNKIQFQYNYLVNVTADGKAMGSRATIGLENADGTDGVQYSYNEAVLTSGDALLFTPQDGSYTVDTNPGFLNYLLRDSAGASAPAALTAPADGTTTSSPINLQWDAGAGASYYSLHLSDTPDFTSFLIYKQGLTDTVLDSVYLPGRTDYYWRVGSTNGQGTQYSNSYTFTTDNTMPRLSSGAIAQVASTTASVYGFVEEGSSPLLEYGHVWSTSPDPTVSSGALRTIFTPQANGDGDYVSELTGLSNNTGYYVKAYATTEAGTVYGTEAGFRTTIPSGNSFLKQLEVSEGALNPSFDPAKNSYSAEVAYSVSEIAVTPYTDDPTATVTVNGEPVLSGEASQAIQLGVGENTIAVRVTAQNGSERLYEIKVTRDAMPQMNDSPPATQPVMDDSPPATQPVKVVTDGKTVFVTLDIKRTLEAGQKVDHVQLDFRQAEEIIQKAVEHGAQRIRILIDSLPGDEADVIVAEVTAEALQLFSTHQLSWDIETPWVTLFLNADSLRQLKEDGEHLYFRIMQMHGEDKDYAAEILQDETLLAAAGTGAQVVGVPLTIETNYSGYADLIFSLQDLEVPGDAEERKLFFGSLGIFIQHADGDKVFTYGEPVHNEAGEVTGYRISVDKFSVFTFVSAEVLERDAYISGFPNGEFKPNEKVTRAQLATMLANNLAVSEASPQLFGDVAPDHWAVHAISQVNERGLMIGDADQNFRPDHEITRAEIAAIAARWGNFKNKDGANAFLDINGHWAEDAIKSVSSAGMMQGYDDGSFRPNQALTRAEAVIVINRLLGRGALREDAASFWSDVSRSHGAFGHIEAASRSYFSVRDSDGYERVILDK